MTRVRIQGRQRLTLIVCVKVPERSERLLAERWRCRAPRRIRTSDHRIRSPTLYPAELGAQWVLPFRGRPTWRKGYPCLTVRSSGSWRLLFSRLLRGSDRSTPTLGQSRTRAASSLTGNLTVARHPSPCALGLRCKDSSRVMPFCAATCAFAARRSTGARKQRGD